MATSPSPRLAIAPLPPPVMRIMRSKAYYAAGAGGRTGVAAPEQLPAPPGAASEPEEEAASDGRGQGRDIGNEKQRRPLSLASLGSEELV